MICFQEEIPPLPEKMLPTAARQYFLFVGQVRSEQHFDFKTVSHVA